MNTETKSTPKTPHQAVRKGKNKGAGAQAAAERQRNFATVVYPDSAPENWFELLNAEHVPAFVSPLHDGDIDPDGNQKKPHYHVLVMYESPKNFERQVKPLFDSIGGVGREKVMSMRGYARYLCHMDNPEKHQYSPDDILSLGGADYSAVIHLPGDDIKMLRDIQQFIRVNQIFSFAEFMDIASAYNDDWFALVSTSRAYVVDKYIKSLQWEEQSGYIRKADKEQAEQEPQLQDESEQGAE